MIQRIGLHFVVSSLSSLAWVCVLPHFGHRYLWICLLPDHTLPILCILASHSGQATVADSPPQSPALPLDISLGLIDTLLTIITLRSVMLYCAQLVLRYSISYYIIPRNTAFCQVLLMFATGGSLNGDCLLDRNHHLLVHSGERVSQRQYQQTDHGSQQ